MVGHAAMPSLREIWIRSFFTPMVTMSLRFSPVVRSPLIADQDRPRSGERNTF